MRHPVWILNSSLFMFLISSLVLVIFLREKPPRWNTITPTQYTEPAKGDAKPIDVSLIYNNDLFNTFNRVIDEPEKQSFVSPLPAPPQALPIVIPKPEAPKFMEPLQITLKGCIVTGETLYDRAIISDNKTTQENSFKVGDKISDSTLLRIFRNRILLVRSNGQEETLYLREEEAKIGPAFHSSDQWESVIEKIKESTFTIDPFAFKKAIPSLASLIENLDLTTVYKKGHSAGVRVGKLMPGSLGKEIDLSQGDIILSVNGIPITTNRNRLSIYQTILGLPLGETIAIVGKRNNTDIYRTVVLNAIGKPFINAFDKEGTLPKVQPPEKTAAEIQEDKINLLQQKQTLAPTLDRIRKNEKRSILKQIKNIEHKQQTESNASFDI